MAPTDIRPRGYLPSFVIPPGEKGIERRRRLADVLAQQGTSTEPVQSWTQGVARVAQSLAGVLGNYQANQMEGQRQSALAEALRGGTADQLMMSMDPDLQRVGIYKAQQAQEAAAAQRQAENDARSAERQASEPPHVQEIKGPNGETLGLAQWDRASRRYVPFQAPEGVAPAAGLGGIAQSNKPLTEGEAKLGMYTNRALKANDLLSSGADASLTDITSNLATHAPGVLEPLGNYMKSPEYRDAEGYGGEFLTAILRQESQATIRPDEMRDYGKIFLPQPGDQPRDIERKRGARVRAIEGLRLGLASRDILLREMDSQRQGASSLSPNAPPPHPIQGAPAPVPEARAGEVPLPTSTGGGLPYPNDDPRLSPELWASWPPEVQRQWMQSK